MEAKPEQKKSGSDLDSNYSMNDKQLASSGEKHSLHNDRLSPQNPKFELMVSEKERAAGLEKESINSKVSSNSQKVSADNYLGQSRQFPVIPE